MSTSTWLASAPRMRSWVCEPTGPLRATAMPGRSRSRLAVVVAWRSMISWRVTRLTALPVRSSGCGSRAAVTMMVSLSGPAGAPVVVSAEASAGSSSAAQAYCVRIVSSLGSHPSPTMRAGFRQAAACGRRLPRGIPRGATPSGQHAAVRLDERMSDGLASRHAVSRRDLTRYKHCRPVYGLARGASGMLRGDRLPMRCRTVASVTTLSFAYRCGGSDGLAGITGAPSSRSTRRR